ncbi:MAG: ATP synthase F1 subunit gamma [Coprobacillus sp.]|nr:ATP synthase F1 subunit gamma [Coprobacillus sp.]
MPEQLIAIKSRIKSVSSVLKITKAMGLVATVKVNRWKNQMLSNRTYIDELEDMAVTLLSSCNIKDTPFVETNSEVSGILYLFITSSLGLCGSYNANLFKFMESIVTSEDTVLVLGKKGLAHYENTDLFKVNTDFSEYSTSQNAEDVSNIGDYLVKAYLNHEYKEIHIIYTMYKNSITFVPTDFTLLPLTSEQSDDSKYIIYEPDKKTIIERLIPMYLTSVVHTKLLEAELSENAARSTAMDNASDNANDILDDLSLEYNKARQGKITEEITEIVAASRDR